jgi:anaerobic selenocysteine-containing dehydrogenase
VRAIACLPALNGAWRQRAGGVLLSSSGAFPGSAALQRQLLAGRAAQHQHGDHWRRPAARPRRLRPEIEALVVYNSNPVAVAPDRQGGAGLAREDLFTVVLEHFLTDTADYADYMLPATTQLEHWDVHLAYGHTDVLLNRPAIAPQGQARSNARSSATWRRAWASPSPALPTRRSSCAARPMAKVDFALLLDQGFAPLPCPSAVCRRRLSHASGKCEFFSQRLADQGRSAARPCAQPRGGGSSTLYPLAMISPPARNFLNSSFVNVKACATSRAPAAGDAPRGRRRARHCRRRPGARVQRPRQLPCHAALNGRARPGVVNGLGIWWRKLGLAAPTSTRSPARR